MIQVVKNEKTSPFDDGPWEPVETINIGCGWGEAWYRVLVVNRLAPKNRVYGLACCWKQDDEDEIDDHRQLPTSSADRFI